MGKRRIVRPTTKGKKPMQNDSRFHELPWRIRYVDTDKMGVVYYANYLAYFEAGRTEYFRAMGHTYADLEERGVFLAVVEVHCRYRAPARYDQIIKVRTWVGRVRRTRIDFHYKVLNESGNLLADGWSTLACLDSEGRPRPLPDEVRETLEGLVVPAK